VTAVEQGLLDPPSARPVRASVDRSQVEATTSARLLAYLDKRLMDEAGMQVGDVVELTGPSGRRTLARLGESDPRDAGRGVVRLDRFVRQALKARMNDEVELRAAPQDIARRVVLAAPVDVSRAHHLIEHLTELFTVSETPCAVGGRLYATFRGSNAGTVYEVVEVDGDTGVFGPQTELEVEVPEVRRAEGEFDISFEDVGGLGTQVTLLRELIQLPLQMPFVYRQLGINAPRGVILYGPPGCGKTHLARAVASDVNARFYFINGPAIVGTMQGETEANLRKIFNEAAHHAPSMIFIDEIDAIAPHRDQSGSQTDIRTVTTMLTLLDGLQKVDGVVIVATTNRVDAMDAALRRPGRFDREIFVGPPTAAGRLEILEIHSREMPLSDAALDHLPEVARLSHGFVGADLMELAREAGLNCLRRSSAALTDHLAAFRIDPRITFSVEAEDFDEALTKISPSALRGSLVAVPEVGWSDVGGLSAVKDRLRTLVQKPLEEPDLFRSMSIRPPSGVLLSGPSGTGKTMLVHALARESGVNFLAVDGPEVFSKWLGESEESVRQVFTLARQLAPAVVFFDQIDAIAPLRGADLGTKTTERVVNQLLAEIDAVAHIPDIVVIGATNRIDLIDPSLLRAGRLGHVVEVPLPDEAGRREILSLQLQTVAVGPDLDEVVTDIAQGSEGMSGADLGSVVQSAQLLALEEVDFAAMAPVLAHHLRAALLLERRS
jgi:transitional endoplasmic reticulum ATPase